MILLWILIIFSVSLTAWCIYVRRFLNPYRLHFIFGKKGSGKSTYMVKMMLKYLKKGWSVYTDIIDVNIPGVRIISADDLGEYVPVENSALFLDEAGILFDSRNFKNFKPELRDFFKLQRKYRCIVYMNSQSFDVDKKIRDLTDYMYLQVNLFHVFSVGKRIEKHVALVQSTSQGDSRIAEDLKFSPFWRWTWTLIPRYTKYFESFRAPERPNLTYTEITGDLQELTDRKILKRIAGKKKGKFEE